MKSKKFVTIPLCGALVASMITGAFATSPTPKPIPTPADDKEVVIQTWYQEPNIDVVVSSQQIQAFINPYGTPVALTTTGKAIAGQQIVTMPAFIGNKSTSDLSVGATITTTLNSVTDPTTQMKLVASEAAIVGNNKPDSDPNYMPPSTAKSAFVFFQMANTTLTDTAIGDTLSDTAIANWNYDYTETTDNDGIVTPKAGCLVLNTTKPASGKKLVTLRKANNGGTIANGGVAMFRLAGKAVSEPKIAWTENDGFTTRIVFNFSVAPTDPAPTTTP